MKSLHLTNAYHPTSGGIREFYHALLRHAPQADHHMRLVVPCAETKVDDLDSHTRIYHVRAPHSPFFDTRYRLLLPPRVLGPRSDVLDILQAEQPDLIEVCDKYSLFYLAGAIRKGWIRMKRRPVLVGLSCERMDDNVASDLGLGAIGKTLASLYMRRIYLPQFDCHLANSHYTAGELMRQARKHPRTVRVWPMGVDVDRFGPHRRSAEWRQALLDRVGGTESSRLLVYAGRLSSEKNVLLLPRVQARSPMRWPTSARAAPRRARHFSGISAARRWPTCWPMPTRSSRPTRATKRRGSHRLIRKALPGASRRSLRTPTSAPERRNARWRSRGVMRGNG